MEWLRCNKCYKSLLKSSNNFIMTLCGHIFCDSCLSKAPDSRCYECGTLVSRSLPLTNPPKLETIINYFSSATHVLQHTAKAVKFHDEQLAISLRGFDILEKKYELAKKYYEESRNAVRHEQRQYQTKVDLIKKMTAAVQPYRALLSQRRIVSTPSVNPHQAVFETPPISGSSSNSSWRQGKRHRDFTSPVESNIERRQIFPGSRPIPTSSSSGCSRSNQSFDNTPVAQRNAERRQHLDGSRSTRTNLKLSSELSRYSWVFVRSISSKILQKRLYLIDKKLQSYLTSSNYSRGGCPEPRSERSNMLRPSKSTMEPVDPKHFESPMIVSQSEFVVPSIKRVPKSAMSYKRKNSMKELPRLSAPRF
ncbi:RING finger protein 212B-like isoform X2 [Venturia canescens]|uniref:RING finger protein 212B-like isoform X2 n=1 Tax=Venturia canescens TaxID=32260 RepID=UPI001C9C520B|nr:RING finger protein 212B-like isoform X2 [Venturia canescens]